MIVYKFGGASLKDADTIRNMLNIVLDSKSQNRLLIIVSAMAKTTNGLETVLDNYWENKNYVANLRKIKDFHREILENLFPDTSHAVFEMLNRWEDYLQKKLSQANQAVSYDQLYDLIVGQGEIISSRIIEYYLHTKLKSVTWVNARDLILTDSKWREGNVDWTATRVNIQEKLHPVLKKNIVVSQGFIGADSSGSPTTLGREGSDFSASIFAHCLAAKNLTIWKDVPGVLNADPKRYQEAILYPQLSYLESSIMSKYGASVIHPKTIAPLAKKNIQLCVKSFLSPFEPGTCISNIPSSGTTPALIYREKQVLIRFKAQDFNFIKEVELSIVFQWINQCHLKINYLHKKATELLICVDSFPRRIQKLKNFAQEEFIFSTQNNVELLTMMNPQQEFRLKVTQQRNIILESHSEDLYQAILSKE